MAVVPCSRLLIKPPLTPPSRLAFPSHPRSLVPASSSPLRLPSLRRSRRYRTRSNGGASETLEGSEADEERKKAQDEDPKADEKQDDAAASTAAASAVAEELKQMMEARRKESAASPSSEFWGGVAEEVREIEWPPFGKVLGTTGVVLAVIAGSSVALLTVNAILAEISDKIFAGKGIQDFF